ncbi:MAG TPA: YafY family protein [Ktedonobacterales bacterium]|jgi:predicted DNA-binding transcriptional regulator YafY
MYSPTTRLLTVLELLESRQQVSGPELARRLEVDERTVRRYIVMLQDLGIPVEAARGVYGAYRLRRGHRLPPLMFTDDEAVALTLGLLAIREFHFPVDVAAVEGALAKTERVLPEQPLQQARSLQEAITFHVPTPPVSPQHDFVMTLSNAVQRRRRVHMRYRAWGGDASERDFDPYGIVFNEGFWHTAGYCHLRHDLRTFRVDRIIALEPVESGKPAFERPEDFDVLGYVLRSVAFTSPSDQVEVLLETTMEQARQAIPAIMGALEPAENGVIFRRGATQLEWIAHILLTLDFPVHVRQPAALRDLLRQLASRALEIVGDGD